MCKTCDDLGKAFFRLSTNCKMSQYQGDNSLIPEMVKAYQAYYDQVVACANKLLEAPAVPPTLAQKP